MTLATLSRYVGRIAHCLPVENDDDFGAPPVEQVRGLTERLLAAGGLKNAAPADRAMCLQAERNLRRKMKRIRDISEKEFRDYVSGRLG